MKQDMVAVVAGVGQRLVADQGVVEVSVKVRLRDGSVVMYDSKEDPAFVEKYDVFAKLVGWGEDDE